MIPASLRALDSGCAARRKSQLKRICDAADRPKRGCVGGEELFSGSLVGSSSSRPRPLMRRRAERKLFSADRASRGRRSLATRSRTPMQVLHSE
jgi:hypothetical protein